MYYENPVCYRDLQIHSDVMEKGIISKVWCSMEFVCSNADSYSTVKENKKEFDSANP